MTFLGRLFGTDATKPDAVEKNFEASYPRMDGPKRASILRKGSDIEKTALLKVMARHEGSDDNETLLAVIDLLASGTLDVRQEAMKYLLTTKSMPATAWKLAYELRNRDLYKDELVMPQAQSIAVFAASPALGAERARAAIDFLRAYPLDAPSKETFDERFRYFSRDEEKISSAALVTRSKDKTLCRQCGKKMKMTPQGPLVQLRCDACDITRFEKRQDVK